MKELRFDSDNVVTLSFASRSRLYSLCVNSVLVLCVPEYMFDKKGFVWFARAAVRLFNCKK